MFRLIRLLLSLALIAVCVYVAVAVPLGRKTLWEHLRAIAGSKESKELVEEVKEKAGRMLHRDAGEARGPGGAGTGKGSGDELTPGERRQLRKLIREKLEPGSNPGK